MSESADIRDPVCGKPVDPLRARAVGIFGGVTHYFCSPECKAQFGDPRNARATASPDGVERRSGDASGMREHTGEWFAKGATVSRPAPRERFADLDVGAIPRKAAPPSPSLLVEVNAVRKKGRPWLWVGLGLLALAALLLGLRR